MKRRPGSPDPVLARADAPTLALSTVRLDAARLRQLLIFERSMRSLAPAGCTAEQTSSAHAAALTASGLAASEVEAPLALLRRFAANRSLSARLSERLEALQARASHDAVAAEQVDEVRRRLVALEEALRSREDPATRQVLESHSAEVLALFAAPTADV
jgi:small-conductance mechanosensitive channel